MCVRNILTFQYVVLKFERLLKRIFSSPAQIRVQEVYEYVRILFVHRRRRRSPPCTLPVVTNLCVRTACMIWARRKGLLDRFTRFRHVGKDRGRILLYVRRTGGCKCDVIDLDCARIFPFLSGCVCVLYVHARPLTARL